MSSDRPEAARLLFPPRPLPRDLRLWWIDLDRWAEEGPSPDLSEEIRSRADRMVHREDARRLLAAHHALRWLLARSLDRRPEELAFSVDVRGKPRLRDGSIHFNLSRGGPWALLGTSRVRSVGVDVEALCVVQEAEALAREHLSMEEREAWTASADRDRTFLRIWTRKEACAKACGAGVRLPFRGLAVGASPGPRRVSVPAGAAAGRSWRLLVVSPTVPAPAVAAVAVGRRRASGRAPESRAP